MSGKFDGGQGLAWAVASKWLLVALGGAQLVMAAIHLAQLQWPTLVCIAPLPLLTYRAHAELSRRSEELTLLPMVRYAQLDLERKRRADGCSSCAPSLPGVRACSAVCTAPSSSTTSATLLASIPTVESEPEASFASAEALAALFGEDAYVQPELTKQTWARLRKGRPRPVKRGEWVAPPKCLRVAVLGATGGVGQQVTRLALAAGHTVVALVREPGEMVPRRARRLHTFRFDAHSCSSLELAPLLNGCDLVLSCLGNRRGEPPVVHRGTATLLAAMVAAGVPRMAMLSCVGVGDSGAQLRRTGAMGWLYSLMFATLLSSDKEDLAAAEAACLGMPRAEGVACIVVRAADLIDGEGLGRYHVATSTEPVGASVARVDVARFLLSLSSDDRHDGRAVSVSQRPRPVVEPEATAESASQRSALTPGPDSASGGAAGEGDAGLRPAQALLGWLPDFSRGAAGSELPMERIERGVRAEPPAREPPADPDERWDGVVEGALAQHGEGRQDMVDSPSGLPQSPTRLQARERRGRVALRRPKAKSTERERGAPDIVLTVAPRRHEVADVELGHAPEGQGVQSAL